MRWGRKQLRAEIVTVSAVIVVIIGWFIFQHSQSPTTFVLPSLPIGVQYTCQNGSSNLSCYAAHYQEITKTKGVAAAFAELKTAYSSDPFARTYCHPLAHVIGRTEADTLQDLTKAFAQGDHFCLEGYYHGVMESIVYRIGSGNLAVELPKICAETTAEADAHFNCVHGLGHGVMAVSDNDVFASLQLCGRLSGIDQQSCASGVFMENTLDEINPDHPAKGFKNGEPMYPCTAVDRQYQNTCYAAQTPHALRAANNDFLTVFKECAVIVSGFRQSCYQSLGRDAAGHAQGQVAQTIAACRLGPDQEAQANCFNGAVGIFHDYYLDSRQANPLCLALPADYQYICPKTPGSS